MTATVVTAFAAFDSAKDQVASAPSSSWPMLLSSLALMTASNLCVGGIWIGVLQTLHRARIDHARLLRFFVLTWPARYIPGTLPYHASRVLLAQRFGVARAMVATSIAYEAVLQAAAAGLVGLVFTLAALGVSRSLGSVYFLLVLPIALLPLLLRPAVLLSTANLLLSLAGREAISRDAILGLRATFIVLLAYLVAYIVNGFAFYLVLNGLFDPPVSLLLAIGAYNLAGAAGIAVVFVPSGLGVREAVIVGLLSTTISPENALLAAATARGVSVFADLAPLPAVAAIEFATRIRRRLDGRQSLPSTPKSA
jgi:uncharacterized membrane protein YbhN (UPF0104 family)